MPRKLVSEAWLSYRDAVIPKDAGSTQLIETRRAFYAGCHSLLTAIMGALEPGTDATDADLGIMEGIQSELDQFNEQVKAGVA
jgi:hypothetical protein